MNTWGISGPVFLGMYATALVVVAGVALWGGRRKAGPPGDDGQLDQYEVAMLNGGERLVAIVALVNLDRQGSVALGDHILRDLAAAGDVDLGTVTAEDVEQLGVSLDLTLLTDVARDAHPVEKAVHKAASSAEPRSVRRVVEKAGRDRVVVGIRAGLVDRGLLYDDDDRRRLHRQWLRLVPLLAVGAFRLSEGLRRGRPVLFLLGLLAVTIVLMVVVGRRRLVRTRRADRLLGDLRRDNVEAPARTMAGGAASLGMAVALTGTGTLFASDPALALAVGPDADGGAGPHRWWGGRGDTGGSGYGGSGGGCSSGGGGGCGGGGGGCGGGGCGG